MGLPRWLSGKESTCQWRRCRRCTFDPLVGNILWRRNGHTLQYSCLENSMVRGVWQAIAHSVTESQTWLSAWAHTCVEFIQFKMCSRLYSVHELSYCKFRSEDQTEDIFVIGKGIYISYCSARETLMCFMWPRQERCLWVVHEAFTHKERIAYHALSKATKCRRDCQILRNTRNFKVTRNICDCFIRYVGLFIRH